MVILYTVGKEILCLVKVPLGPIARNVMQKSYKPCNVGKWPQVFYWLQYDEKIVDEIPIEGNGWTFDGERVIPVWFTGMLFTR